MPSSRSFEIARCMGTGDSFGIGLAVHGKDGTFEEGKTTSSDLAEHDKDDTRDEHNPSSSAEADLDAPSETPRGAECTVQGLALNDGSVSVRRAPRIPRPASSELNSTSFRTVRYTIAETPPVQARAPRRTFRPAYSSDLSGGYQRSRFELAVAASAREQAQSPANLRRRSYITSPFPSHPTAQAGGVFSTPQRSIVKRRLFAAASSADRPSRPSPRVFSVQTPSPARVSDGRDPFKRLNGARVSVAAERTQPHIQSIRQPSRRHGKAPGPLLRRLLESAAAAKSSTNGQRSSSMPPSSSSSHDRLPEGCESSPLSQHLRATILTMDSASVTVARVIESPSWPQCAAGTVIVVLPRAITEGLAVGDDIEARNVLWFGSGPEWRASAQSIPQRPEAIFIVSRIVKFAAPDKEPVTGVRTEAEPHESSLAVRERFPRPNDAVVCRSFSELELHDNRVDLYCEVVQKIVGLAAYAVKDRDGHDGVLMTTAQHRVSSTVVHIGVCCIFDPGLSAIQFRTLVSAAGENDCSLDHASVPREKAFAVPVFRVEEA